MYEKVWLEIQADEQRSADLSPRAKNGFYLFKFIFNVYLFLRESKRARRGGGEREGETQNLKQASVSELSVQSQTWDSNSQTAKS